MILSLLQRRVNEHDNWLAVERADVCLILIDAREGVTEQDTKIAGLAHEAGKASIVVVNKWDLVDKETGTMEKMRKDIMRDLSFMSYAPVLFISALTGQRTDRLFELINFVNDHEVLSTCFILDMETKFLCKEDCKGLCPSCGKNLNLGPCGCRKEIDPRFAVLEQLLDK